MVFELAKGRRIKIVFQHFVLTEPTDRLARCVAELSSSTGDRLRFKVFEGTLATDMDVLSKKIQSLFLFFNILDFTLTTSHASLHAILSDLSPNKTQRRYFFNPK